MLRANLRDAEAACAKGDLLQAHACVRAALIALDRSREVTEKVTRTFKEGMDKDGFWVTDHKARVVLDG